MLLSRQPATLESLRCTLDNEYEKVATVEVVLHAFTASASFQSASAAYWSVVNVLGSSLLFSTLIVGKDKKKKKADYCGVLYSHINSRLLRSSTLPHHKLAMKYCNEQKS